MVNIDTTSGKYWYVSWLYMRILCGWYVVCMIMFCSDTDWLELMIAARRFIPELILSWGVFPCLPWFFPAPLLWGLQIPLGRGMMNIIWGFGGVVCLFFCLSMAFKMWEPILWRENCSHVWVSVPGIKLITSFFLNIILIRL